MKIVERKVARKLRSKGQAITTIAKQLNVAKSSVFEWTRDIELTDEQRKNLQKNLIGAAIGSVAMSIKYRNIRNNWFNEGKKLAKKDIKFRALCTLYWGEGTKGRNKFGIANSDIQMIKIVNNYIKNTWPKEKAYLEIRVYRNPGFSKKNILTKWYMQNVNIKIKILINKQTKKSHNILYYGTGYYWINSTRLTQMVLGGIEYIREVGIVG